MRTCLALLILLLTCSFRLEESPKRFPSFDELWVSKDTLVSLAKYHGVLSLKITEDEAFIRRNSKWIPVLKRSGS